MKRSRRKYEQDNTDRWVVSYADFITLLFAFFTTMYAISHVDVGKLEKFAGSMRSAFKAKGVETSWSVIDEVTPVDPDIVGIEKKFKSVIDAFPAQKGIRIRRDERGVVVSLGEQVLFEVGKADIKEEAIPVLTALASVIEELPNNVIIEGHTDSVPIHNSKYASNWELSTARATSVLSYLLKNYNLSPERFSAAGYGEFRPIAPNETPEGRAKNRRVDIVIVQD
jgi:chemotaxis protein MotB